MIYAALYKVAVEFWMRNIYNIYIQIGATLLCQSVQIGAEQRDKVTQKIDLSGDTNAFMGSKGEKIMGRY